MSTVTYDFAQGVASIVLSDAERGNPLNLESTTALLDAVRRASADDARVVVLSAEGRFFSVGGDLRQFASAPDMAELIDELADRLHRLISELMRSDAIVLAVVQGTAAGAGFALAAAADIIIASDEAIFTTAYTRIGLSQDGGTSLLVQTLGLHRALRLVLLNDQLTAGEALDAGLLSRVVPPSELRGTTDQIVANLIGGSAGAFAAAKHLLRELALSHPETTMKREALSIRSLASGPGARASVEAFLQRQR
jgi:2-(1,2-epoxy-1,2-dihydrophenyl)acetyl-CoA isomerase